MLAAKNKIIFPLDFPDLGAAKYWIDLLGDKVGLYKVGLELFIGCGRQVIEHIQEQSRAEIFLDLKLHDIPNTVERAMRAIAALNIRFATVHCAGGAAMLEAAVTGAQGQVDVLGVTVLTSLDATDLAATGHARRYVADVSALVAQRADMAQSAGCAGIVCSGREVGEVKQRMGSHFLAVVPGIRPQWENQTHADQKRVATPTQAIAAGADYLVIGRPILEYGNALEAICRIVAEIESACPAHQ